MTNGVDHPIDLAEHDVERADQRDDVGDQVALAPACRSPCRLQNDGGRTRNRYGLVDLPSLTMK